MDAWRATRDDWRPMSTSAGRRLKRRRGKTRPSKSSATQISAALLGRRSLQCAGRWETIVDGTKKCLPLPVRKESPDGPRHAARPQRACADSSPQAAGLSGRLCGVYRQHHPGGPECQGVAPVRADLAPAGPCVYGRVAQFIAVCRRSKWSKDRTNSPLLALRAMAGSKAAHKISSACSKAF